MKPRLLFDLPVLRPPTPQSFDTRPAAVGKWLAQLPMGSLGETSRQIFVVLFELNRTQLPAAQRLAFLERLATPLSLILPALQHHYMGLPFPLAEKSRRVARMASELQVEVVIGYRLVLEGLRYQPWFKRWGREDQSLLAAHRMLHYLGGILSDYQWQHLHYPRSVWHTVHRIFRREGRAGRARLKVAALKGAESTISILDEYKRLLLRALVPPSRIPVEQWQRVNTHLLGWLSLVELDPTSVEYGFWISLDSDNPPTELPMDFVAAMGDRGNYTVLNTRGLVQHLEQLLASAALPAGLERETVEALAHAWNGVRTRHDRREDGSHEEVQLVAGITGLYQVLANVSLRQVAQYLETEQSAAQKKHPEQPWKDMAAPPPKPAVAFLIDHSDSGYGLELPDTGEQQLLEGDLVGLRFPGSGAWTLGYVCWLRAETGKPLRLGIQQLATESVPAELNVQLRDGRSTPLGCVLGTTTTGTTALFMPHLPGIEHKSLQLGYGGHQTPIVLGERFDSSIGFSAFLFDFPSATSETAAPGTAAQDTWQHRAEARMAASAEAGRYDDVWSSL